MREGKGARRERKKRDGWGIQYPQPIIKLGKGEETGGGTVRGEEEEGILFWSPKRLNE